LILTGCYTWSRRTEVAESVKERLMKKYQSEMATAAKEQEEKNRRRAARPIIAFMIILFVLGVTPLIIKMC